MGVDSLAAEKVLVVEVLSVPVLPLVWIGFDCLPGLHRRLVPVPGLVLGLGLVLVLGLAVMLEVDCCGLELDSCFLGLEPWLPRGVVGYLPFLVGRRRCSSRARLGRWHCFSKGRSRSSAERDDWRRLGSGWIATVRHLSRCARGLDWPSCSFWTEAERLCSDGC